MANNFTVTQTTTLLNDVDGDGVIDPGDTVTTTVTITNNSTDTSAPNVSFDETLNGMTQVGNVHVTPIAFDDTGYNAVGNVTLTIAAPQGVLINDIDPNAAVPLTNNGVTAISLDLHDAANNPTNGIVVLNTDGSFTFTRDGDGRPGGLVHRQHRRCHVVFCKNTLNQRKLVAVLPR